MSLGSLHILSRLFLGWLVLNVAAGTDAAAQRIGTGPGAVALIAESLIDADEGQRREFADTLLDVLLDTYGEELENAVHEKVTSEKGRAKIRRWRQATNELVERLIDARLRLTEGAPVTIHVDAQHQVLLFIDDQVVAFSAPRPSTEQLIDDLVVEQYCGFHDCSVLDTPTGPRANSGTGGGSWTMRDRAPPAFEVDGRVRCVFGDLGARTRKQRACLEAIDEAEALADAIERTTGAGERIDWSQMSAGRSASGPDTLFRLSEKGAYVRRTMPRLSRLDDVDWSALVRWLRQRLLGTTRTLSIERADRLLPDE